MDVDAEKIDESAARHKTLVDFVFSWSFEDVINGDLHKEQVKPIGKIFPSLSDYMKSFVFPLIEDTRADLHSGMESISSAPVCEILSIERNIDCKSRDDLRYIIELGRSDIGTDVQRYEPETSDLIAITDVNPRCIDDLNRPRTSYVIALVQKTKYENDSILIQVVSSKPILMIEDNLYNSRKASFFAVYLINMTTNVRIWKALNSELDGKNMTIIKQVTQVRQPDSAVGDRCHLCLTEGKYRIAVVNSHAVIRRFKLNDSQVEAILKSIATKECYHENTVKLIWGPPGTGKTKTVSALLFALLQIKCKTVTCAPTNIAVLEVTTRVLTLVMESLEYDTYGLGDIVLFGNGERMKIDDHDELHNIFLDFRAKILAKCFAPSSGWKHLLESMICLLEDPNRQYQLYLSNKQERDESDDEDGNKEKDDDEHDQKRGIRGKSMMDYNQGVNKKMYARDFMDENNKRFWRSVIAQTLKENKTNGYENSKRRYNLRERKKDDRLQFCFEKRKMNFEEFVKKRFNSKWQGMKFCVVNFCTHLPTSHISLKLVKSMIRALNLMEYFGNLLNESTFADTFFKEVVNGIEDAGVCAKGFNELSFIRKECLQMLQSLPKQLIFPVIHDEYSIKTFCLKNACLFFCTASSSVRLHSTTTELLIIDEAAQLKECESMIPLQLPGLRHAILIGDEQQLPAVVKSKISEEAEFGRSLFGRLVSLGFRKHLLDMQYRMHPSISLFPNREFYQRQILDAPNVKERSYQMQCLRQDMYGSYAFINVPFGNEELNDGRSLRNMVEVTVVCEMVAYLFKVFSASKRKVNIGIISPYNAQVFAIREKLGTTYDTDEASDFSIRVRSIDGFQGGEEDVIILSTVRCNGNGSVGFLSNRQRANVALTRARYCLWILGHGDTLTKSGSIWKNLVVDAKARGCFYDAHENKNLAKAIVAALVDIDPIDVSLNIDKLLFTKAKWKVYFSKSFWKSMANIMSIEIRKAALSMLTELSSGWRQAQYKESLIIMNGISGQMLEFYRVDESVRLVWSVDIIEENSHLIQVLKFWDILPSSEIANLLNHLNNVFGNYSLDAINLCQLNCVEGNFGIPLKWPIPSNGFRKTRLPEMDPAQLLCSQFSVLSLKD